MEGGTGSSRPSGTKSGTLKKRFALSSGKRFGLASGLSLMTARMIIRQGLSTPLRKNTPGLKLFIVQIEDCECLVLASWKRFMTAISRLGLQVGSSLLSWRPKRLIAVIKRFHDA